MRWILYIFVVLPSVVFFTIWVLVTTPVGRGWYVRVFNKFQKANEWVARKTGAQEEQDR